MDSALDSGKMRNYLGLFADDALRKISRDSFFELAAAGSMRKSELAKKLKMSRPKLYKGDALVTDTEIQKRLIPFVYIADLAFLLHGKDRDVTLKWLMAPNHIFLDISPFQMAMVGRADTVIEKLEEWLR